MESISAFDMDLVVTFTAVFVAGLAAVLGIWMERDPKKPPRYAWALSALILLATFVSLMQSFFDKREQDNLKDDMARLLTTMDRLASESDDPALLELVKSELEAQSRSDPEVVEKVAQRVNDEGRDAGEVLGRHLGAAEVEKATRKGTIKPKVTEKVAELEKPEPAKRAPREPAAERAGPETAVAPTRPRTELTPEEQAARSAQIQAARAGRADSVAAAAAAVPVPTPTPAVRPPAETAAAPVAPVRGAAKPAGRKPVAKKPAPKKPRGR